jgi:hypothetical protein
MCEDHGLELGDALIEDRRGYYGVSSNFTKTLPIKSSCFAPFVENDGKMEIYRQEIPDQVCDDMLKEIENIRARTHIDVSGTGCIFMNGSPLSDIVYVNYDVPKHTDTMTEGECPNDFVLHTYDRRKNTVCLPINDQAWEEYLASRKIGDRLFLERVAKYLFKRYTGGKWEGNPNVHDYLH